MNRKIGFLLGAIVACGFSVDAQASTITSGVWHLDIGATTSGYTTYSKALGTFDTLTKNTKIGTKSSPTVLTGVGTPINANLYGGTNNNNNHTYIRKGSGNGYQAPWLSPSPGHPGGSADPTNYMTVEAGGTATFELSKAAHYFGFLWGSVDKFNTVQFFGKNGLLATFTGSDMPNSQGKTGLGGTFYANFTTNKEIWKVVLSSACDAFEIDDVRVSTVPVPAALPLFGAALAGLGVMSRRRRKNAAAA